MEKTKAEVALDEQLKFLLGEYTKGELNVHEFMKAWKMTYQDYMEFYPEERERILGKSWSLGQEMIYE